jgi:hypothetical protein
VRPLRRFRTVVAVAAAALMVGACAASGGTAAPTTTSARTGSATTGSPATTATTAEAYSGPDFYAVPDPLPAGTHGTLLRYQPIEDVTVDGGTAYRVMYLSESVAGHAIAVTGIVLVPDGAAPAGGRRVIALAHGTTGIADDCAPSKNPTHSEILRTVPFVQVGDVVAATDYEGLGTPGRHPYLVGESEGRSVIDAARAARGLPGSGAGTDLAIVGYSQGGHAALWANEVATTWAPELHVFGAVAGAPPSEIGLIFQAGPAAARGFFYMLVAGIQAAYPEADPALILTPAGVADLDLVDQGCASQVLSAFSSLDAADLVKPDPHDVPPWSDLAKQDDAGQVATADPILILHSAADDVVPVVLSAILFDRLCGLHQVVERRVYEKGQGHSAAAPDAFRDAFDWIQARFAGEAAISTCPAG